MDKLTIATLALIAEPLTRTGTMVVHEHSFSPVLKNEKKFFPKNTFGIPPKELTRHGTFYTERRPVISRQ